MPEMTLMEIEGVRAFAVSGSTGLPYTVMLANPDGPPERPVYDWPAVCTCPAGYHGRNCKHVDLVRDSLR